MTFAHEAVAALPSGANADAAAIRAMCERRFAYVLDTTESAANFVAVDPVSGTLPLYLLQSGILFQYDSTDSTTTADGVTCLVSSEGKRYKTNGVATPYAVLSRTTSAQPGSPTVGDAYIVPTAATGAAWAGQDGKVAIYTARGWQFAVSPIGREIYVRDVDAYYHRNASGVWAAGVGSVALQAGSVTLQNVLGANASFAIKIENQTTNTPPVSPTPPTAYIIGSSPTGAWASNAGKLAMCLAAGAFTIISPVNGDAVYDKSANTSYTFNGTAWISSAGAWSKHVSVFTAATDSTVVGSGSYTFSGTAPTTTFNRVSDAVTLSYTAKSASSNLFVSYAAMLTCNTQSNVVFGLFKDAGASAIAWDQVYHGGNGTLHRLRFKVPATDVLSHTFQMAAFNTGGVVAPQNVQHRLFEIEEESV